MLSGETASGAHPVEAVATMRRIVNRAEKELGIWGHAKKLNSVAVGVTDAVSDAAVLISKQVGASAIISLTKSGSTAKMVSKHRPTCPVLGVTSSRTTWRELALWWGIHPVRFHEFSDLNVAAREAINACVSGKHIQAGELVVITAGVPFGLAGTTNMVEVLTTGEILLSGSPLVRKIARGRVRVALDAKQAEKKVTEDCVLVVRHLGEEYKNALGKVKAVISESSLDVEGTMLALERDVPCVVGVSDAMSALTDDMEVTIDGMRGLIYRGRVDLVL
jgi:pyruvate kinase